MSRQKGKRHQRRTGYVRPASPIPPPPARILADSEFGLQPQTSRFAPLPMHLDPADDHSPTSSQRALCIVAIACAAAVGSFILWIFSR